MPAGSLGIVSKFVRMRNVVPEVATFLAVGFNMFDRWQENRQPGKPGKN